MACTGNGYTRTELPLAWQTIREGRSSIGTIRAHSERYKWIRHINESCLWGRILPGIWNINGEMHFRQRKRMARDCLSIYFRRTILSLSTSGRHALESLFRGGTCQPTFSTFPPEYRANWFSDLTNHPDRSPSSFLRVSFSKHRDTALQLKPRIKDELRQKLNILVKSPSEIPLMVHLLCL